MITELFFGTLLVSAWAHDSHRGGGRIRFPFDGPPPPIEMITGPPRIYSAESQSHPIYHDSPPQFNHHIPFGLMQQIPTISNPYGDGPFRGDTGFAETTLTKHQTGVHNPNRRPTRPKEGLHHFYHETQPPPFVTPPTLMTAAAAGGPQRIKINGHPTATSNIENDSQRHRFTPNRHSERRPSIHRSPPPSPNHERYPSTPPSPYEYEPSSNTYERYPGNESPGGGPDARPRPQQERLRKPEHYPSRERFPTSPSEKPFLYKEKAKVPFNGVKKPLFSPTANQEKAVYKHQSPPSQGFRSPPLNNYPRPTPAEQDGDYYQNKLKEEYYTGLQQTHYSDYQPPRHPASTHQQSVANSQSGQLKPTNEPFQFDMSYFGSQNDDPGSVLSGNTHFPSNLIPQSEEFGDFFEGSTPEWMNEFKSPTAEGQSGKGAQAPNVQRLNTQESQRLQYQQGQKNQQSYFEDDYNIAGQKKYVNKRNPTKQQSSEEIRYYPKSQASQEKRPQQDSFYDAQDSTEFDFGSSSEFSMSDFNQDSFNYGQEQKPAGSEWIPINAPNGAIPAKSFDIPAPNLSQEYSSRPQQLRRQLVKNEKSDDSAEKQAAVVYGARERKRQNEGVVSASVMVKQ